MGKAQEIKSPDGQLTLEVALQNGGVPTCHLTYEGRDFIKTSKLTSGFAIADTKQRTFDESWQQS